MPYKDKEQNRKKSKEYYEENKGRLLLLAKKRYEDNKEYFKKKNAIARERTRNIVNDIKKKGECAVCGIKDHRVLHFHHKNSATKEFKIADADAIGVGKRRLYEEMDKCVLLCANCHVIIHYKEDW